MWVEGVVCDNLGAHFGHAVGGDDVMGCVEGWKRGASEQDGGGKWRVVSKCSVELGGNE